MSHTHVHQSVANTRYYYLHTSCIWIPTCTCCQRMWTGRMWNVNSVYITYVVILASSYVTDVWWPLIFTYSWPAAEDEVWWPCHLMRTVSPHRGQPSSDTHCHPVAFPIWTVVPALLSQHLHIQKHSAAEEVSCGEQICQGTSRGSCSTLWTVHFSVRAQVSAWTEHKWVLHKPYGCT